MKKSRIEQIVASLPETVDVDDLIERLHLLDKIEQAEKQLARGEGVSHETAKQRLSQWLPCAVALCCFRSFEGGILCQTFSGDTKN